MDYVAVFKTADYVDDGVYLADVGKELVAQALALDAPFTRPAMSTNSMTAGVIFSESYRAASCFKRGSRNAYNAYVGINGTEWVIGRFCAGFGQGIKKCTFSHIWQSHDT